MYYSETWANCGETRGVTGCAEGPDKYVNIHGLLTIKLSAFCWVEIEKCFLENTQKKMYICFSDYWGEHQTHRCVIYTAHRDAQRAINEVLELRLVLSIYSWIQGSLNPFKLQLNLFI